MCKLGCLLLAWAICDAVVLVIGEEQNGFVQPLDFGPIFDTDEPGVSSLASNPVAAAVHKVDNSQYPQLFDTIVSSSIDSLQTRLAPRESAFSAEHFGFNPIASQSFLPPAKPANLVAQPKQQPLHSQSQAIPLRYDIRTVHDPNYKVYIPEENEQGEEILSALKKNPNVAAYFKPAETNVEVSHPYNYRKEELSEDSENEQNYKPNAYITGPARIRRYTSGRKRENLKKSSEEEDDPYNYNVEYISKPKAFDSELYSSAYKEEKDPKKDYEYPYGGGYDSGYDHKEYDRIKALSEQQAAEIKQNPGNCKEVQRDGMTCTTCKDPKTGGNFESCSYVAEPKNNKYAYSKERKFDSNDDPDEADAPQQSEQAKQSEKYEIAPNSSEQKFAKLRAPEPNDDDSKGKYKSYYTHSSNPNPSEAQRSAEDKQSSEEQSSLVKPYNYQKALPGFYTNNQPKKDVEHVLAEFKKKDRSTCKKVQKNGMTCFQCIDKAGLKNEECMFVSESAPKRSHLAYQEVKEFTSKPATLDKGSAEGAESQIVTTTAPPAQKSAAYVVDNNTYGKKLKRKKAPHSAAPDAAASNPIVSSVKSVAPSSSTHKTKRSIDSEAEQNAQIADETNIAPPEEFAGADSKGAFWAETMPRYSATLGVSLPEFMLSRSDHEVSFDETVAGA